MSTISLAVLIKLAWREWDFEAMTRPHRAASKASIAKGPHHSMPGRKGTYERMLNTGQINRNGDVQLAQNIEISQDKHIHAGA